MSLAADFTAALDPAVLFEQAFDLEPHDWQRGYLREDRPTVVLKGRQVGASLAAGALAIRTVRYWPDVDAVIVSPTLKQSTEITARARSGLRRLGIPLVQDSTSTLRLANGSRILSLPGTARSVRGWTAKLLILDEAAFIEHETFVAARALVATGGRLVVQSTPAAEVGDFWEIVTSEDADWARYTVRSDEVPTISPEFLEAERRALGPDAYATEYECQFGKTGATLFTAERIADLILPAEPEAVAS
ncbi:MAG: terminase family protein [Candidatus Limnocylindrales bacterium]